METLLALQPFADSMAGFFIFIFVFSAVGCLGFGIGLLINNSETSDPRNSDENKAYHANCAGICSGVLRYMRIAVITSFICIIPLMFVSKSWDMYKNQMAYRVINSETADKTVQNINLLMDKMKKHIDKL